MASSGFIELLRSLNVEVPLSIMQLVTYQNET